jgi:hypothetical protein
MNPVIGMIRARSLRGMRIDDMVGLDLALLLALAMRGDFVHVPTTGWCRRDVRKETSYSQKLERYRSKDYALGTSWFARHFPLARLPCRLMSDVLMSELGASQKFQLVLILCVSLPIKYWVDRRRHPGGAQAAAASIAGKGSSST